MCKLHRALPRDVRGSPFSRDCVFSLSLSLSLSFPQMDEYTMQEVPVWAQRCYEGDAKLVEAAGFDGVKIDNCGDDRGLGYIARLAAINASGHALLVENSNQGKMGNPRGNPTNDSYCPYNFFRSGGDIGPDFNNVISKLQRTLPYLGNETTPVISRPGCWAYPVSCRLRHCCRCRGALGSRVPLLPRASLRAQAHLQPLLLLLLRNRVGHA